MTRHSAHRPRKRFGQHFLADPLVLDSIVTAIAPNMHTRLLEIGPGQGALTERLVGLSQELMAIEIDRDLVVQLRARYSSDELTLHEGDVLRFDLSQWVNVDRPAVIVGNLPYQISTPLLFKLFEEVRGWQQCIFLLQKEVVARMCAQPNSKAYGRLSVMTQYYCQPQALFDVPATAFYPPPQVNSSVVRLSPHSSDAPVAQAPMVFGSIVREAFNHRRKMLGKIFKDVITSEQWMALGIDAKQRPENLSVDDFVRLSDLVDKNT